MCNIVSFEPWAIVAVTVLCAVFIVAQIWRSVHLEKGFSPATMKMYSAAFLGTVVAILALANVSLSAPLTALLGAIIGGVLGSNFGKEEGPSK